MFFFCIMDFLLPFSGEGAGIGHKSSIISNKACLYVLAIMQTVSYVIPWVSYVVTPLPNRCFPYYVSRPSAPWLSLRLLALHRLFWNPLFAFRLRLGSLLRFLCHYVLELRPERFDGGELVADLFHDSISFQSPGRRNGIARGTVMTASSDLFSLLTFARTCSKLCTSVSTLQ